MAECGTDVIGMDSFSHGGGRGKDPVVVWQRVLTSFKTKALLKEIIKERVL